MEIPRSARYTFSLYSAQVLNLFVGWGITRLNVSALSITEFGQFNLFITLINSLFIFFTFGIFEASSRLLALSDGREKSGRILAASLTVTLLSYGLFSLTFYLLRHIFDRIFAVDVSQLVTLFFPLAGIYLLYDFWQKVLRGSGKIYRLAWFMLSPRIIYLSALLVMTWLNLFSLHSTVLFNLSSFGIIFLLFLLFEPLNFSHFHESLRTLLGEVRRFGIHMYWAELIQALLFQTDKLFIAFFLDAEKLAFYSLAFTITFPISLFSTSLATTLYKKFSSSVSIDRRILLLNAIWIIFSVFLLVLLGPWIVRVIFSPDYSPAIPLLIPLAIAFGISGLSKTYTYFLVVKGEGIAIRNISLILIGVNLILNLILIPLSGMAGAAYARIFTSMLDFILIRRTYGFILRKNETPGN